jgi:hypothetical protein
MFFLVRMVFWLAVVVAFLPSDGSKGDAARRDVIAACGQAGVRMLHEFMRTERRQARASARTASARPSHGTLTAADLAPAWRGQRGGGHNRDGA